MNKEIMKLREQIKTLSSKIEKLIEKQEKFHENIPDIEDVFKKLIQQRADYLFEKGKISKKVRNELKENAGLKFIWETNREDEKRRKKRMFKKTREVFGDKKLITTWLEGLAKPLKETTPKKEKKFKKERKELLEYLGETKILEAPELRNDNLSEDANKAITEDPYFLALKYLEAYRLYYYIYEEEFYKEQGLEEVYTHIEKEPMEKITGFYEEVYRDIQNTLFPNKELEKYKERALKIRFGKGELQKFRKDLLRSLEKELFGPLVSPGRIKKGKLKLIFSDHLFSISYEKKSIRAYPEELYDILQKEENLRTAFNEGNLKEIYDIFERYKKKLKLENK